MNIHNPDYDDFEKGLQRLLGAATEPGTEERLREVCAEFRRQLGRHPHIMKPVSASSHATNLSRRAAWVTRLFTLKHWIVTHATASLIIGILMIGTGSAAVVHWLTVQEAAKKFDINDPTLRTVIEAYYRVNQKYPVYFRELTTPVAYIVGPWNPDWGRERVLSDEEEREYAARPKWERAPYSGKEYDSSLWTSLTPKEQDEWVRWRVDWELRPRLVHEWSSPEQKARVLQLGDQYYAELRKVTQELIAQKAPKDEFEREQLNVYTRCFAKPLQAISREVRLERPLLPIQHTVRQYREKYGKSPRTMGDLREFLEQEEIMTPGFLKRWGADRPLMPIELDTPTKWDKAPWDKFTVGRWDWASFTVFIGKYGEKEVYDGYIRDWVDNYFQRYLPYYPFTPDQRKRILEIRDQTFQEMKATLRALVAKKASHWSFGDKQAEIWDKAIARFHEVFREMKSAESGQTTARP